MIKVDLHCHSKYSNHPSEWFLQKIGASESYTDPDAIYEMAKKRGMGFVTITDHNRIEASLFLKEKYPDEVMTGVEVTSYFPQDNCKIHVLVWGLNVSQFEEIQKIRNSIYDIRDFLREQNLAHSIAHATFAINKKLSISHLEELFLLFNVFEAINGGRNKLHNETILRTLKNLTPERMEDLFRKYRIEPFGDEPWKKGFTGGSDDHGGIFIGKTYTYAEASTVDQFIESIKHRETTAGGRCGDFQSLAFTIYKVTYEFSKAKTAKIHKSRLSEIAESVFGNSSPISLGNKIRLGIRRSLSRTNGEDTNKIFFDILSTCRNSKDIPIDAKLYYIYDKISDLSDNLMRALFQSLESNLKIGDVAALIKNFSLSLPTMFLAAPFFSTFYIMCQGRELINYLETHYGGSRPAYKKNILWFTDSLVDLNGVSTTLQKIAWLSHQRGLNIKIAISLSEKDIHNGLPPNIMNLPYASEFNLPYSDSYVMKITSVLKSLKMVYEFEPDEVFISTPGPIGLFGLLVSKLLGVKSVGVYHTDFAGQAKLIANEESLTEFLELFDKLFYSTVDEILVQTAEYFDILESRGLDRSKMRVFKKGIDSKLFFPRLNARVQLHKIFGVQEGINLLFVGRVSEDKNIDVLVESYKLLIQKRNDVNLLIVGDGPYLDKLKEMMKDFDRVIFTGRLNQDELPHVYSSADIFVFPSTSDTFGNVVVEAQSCGCPAIVSDIGGIQELVIKNKTGFVLGTKNIDDWVNKIEYIINLKENQPEKYQMMREQSHANAQNNYDWNVAIDSIFQDTGETIIQSSVEKEYEEAAL